MGVFLLVGCTPKIDDTALLYSCETDTDCIPKPACHAQECINSKYMDDFKMPEVCSGFFDCKAAYIPENCACVDQQCVNKNIDTDCSTERN